MGPSAAAATRGGVSGLLRRGEGLAARLEWLRGWERVRSFAVKVGVLGKAWPRPTPRLALGKVEKRRVFVFRGCGQVAALQGRRPRRESPAASRGQARLAFVSSTRLAFASSLAETQAALKMPIVSREGDSLSSKGLCQLRQTSRWLRQIADAFSAGVPSAEALRLAVVACSPEGAFEPVSSSLVSRLAAQGGEEKSAAAAARLFLEILRLEIVNIFQRGNKASMAGDREALASRVRSASLSANALTRISKHALEEGLSSSNGKRERSQDGPLRVALSECLVCFFKALPVEASCSAEAGSSAAHGVFTEKDVSQLANAAAFAASSSNPVAAERVRRRLKPFLESLINEVVFAPPQQTDKNQDAREELLARDSSSLLLLESFTPQGLSLFLAALVRLRLELPPDRASELAGKALRVLRTSRFPAGIAEARDGRKGGGEGAAGSSCTPQQMGLLIHALHSLDRVPPAAADAALETVSLHLTHPSARQAFSCQSLLLILRVAASRRSEGKSEAPVEVRLQKRKRKSPRVPLHLATRERQLFDDSRWGFFDAQAVLGALAADLRAADRALLKEQHLALLLQALAASAPGRHGKGRRSNSEQNAKPAQQRGSLREAAFAKQPIWIKEEERAREALLALALRRLPRFLRETSPQGLAASFLAVVKMDAARGLFLRGEKGAREEDVAGAFVKACAENWLGSASLRSESLPEPRHFVAACFAAAAVVAASERWHAAMLEACFSKTLWRQKGAGTTAEWKGAEFLPKGNSSSPAVKARAWSASAKKGKDENLADLGGRAVTEREIQRREMGGLSLRALWQLHAVYIHISEELPRGLEALPLRLLRQSMGVLRVVDGLRESLLQELLQRPGGKKTRRRALDPTEDGFQIAEENEFLFSTDEGPHLPEASSLHEEVELCLRSLLHRLRKDGDAEPSVAFLCSEVPVGPYFVDLLLRTVRRESQQAPPREDRLCEKRISF